MCLFPGSVSVILLGWKNFWLTPIVSEHRFFVAQPSHTFPVASPSRAYWPRAWPPVVNALRNGCHGARGKVPCVRRMGSANSAAQVVHVLIDFLSTWSTNC